MGMDYLSKEVLLVLELRRSRHFKGNQEDTDVKVTQG